MGRGHKLALVAGVAAIATTATAQQKVTGPVAVYWMSAQTQTGFGMPSMGAGGGKPDTGAMMRAMLGGGGAGDQRQPMSPTHVKSLLNKPGPTLIR